MELNVKEVPIAFAIATILSSMHLKLAMKLGEYFFLFDSSVLDFFFLIFHLQRLRRHPRISSEFCPLFGSMWSNWLLIL